MPETSVRSKTDTLPTCMNCRSVLYGGYCSRCGQAVTEPITVASSLQKLQTSVRTLDSRWLRTMAALTVDPGRVIRRYIHGRRAPYVAPPVYATVAVALCIGIVFWTDVDLRGGSTPWSPSIESLPSPEGASISETLETGDGELQTGPFDEPLMRAVFAICAAASLLVAAATAWLQRLLYRHQPYNWAETYVFELFVFGHLALHQTLFALLGAFSSVAGLIALAIAFVMILGFALSGFYRRSLWSSMLAAVVLATVQVAGVFVVGAVARLLLTA